MYMGYYHSCYFTSQSTKEGSLLVQIAQNIMILKEDFKQVE